MSPVPRSSLLLVPFIIGLLAAVTLRGSAEASSPKDLPALRTAFSRALLSPDGELSLERGQVPLHYSDAQGAWLSVEPALIEQDDGSFLDERNALISHLPASARDGVVAWRRSDGAWVSARPAGLSVRHADGSVSELERPADVRAEADGPETVAYRETYRGISERYRVEAGRLRHELAISSVPGTSPGDVLVLSWDVKASGDGGRTVLVTEVPVTAVAMGFTDLESTLDSALESLVELPPGLSDSLAGESCEEETQLAASDAEAGDTFGHALSMSGDTAVVGAIDESTGGFAAGAAYVFIRSGTGWTEQAKLTASDAQTQDRFGKAVSVSGDTVLIGAPREDAGGSSAGAAYVFVRTGTSWTEQAKLLPSDIQADDWFGHSVSLSGDTAVIGAVFEDAGAVDAGAAYVFVRTATSWTEQAKLIASDAQAQDAMGDSVCLSASGETVVIGAPGDDTAGNAAGASYVFVRVGTSWTEQAKLTASDGQALDKFGSAVSVSGDTALIGAALEDTGGFSAGAAYVFVRTGTSWAEQAKLTASDAGFIGRFGSAVCVVGDVAVIGSETKHGAAAQAGAAYVFVRDGTIWTELAKLTASDPAFDDRFGSAVSASGDTTIISAPRKNDYTGAAYVFSLAVCFNAPPSCDAGADIDAECDDVTLAGATAEDADGDDLSFSWSSDCGATFSPGPDVLNPTVTLGGSCGLTCTLTLGVDDGNGGTCEDSVVVTVADLTPPQLDTPASLTVECGNSTDPSATGQASTTDECSTPSVSFSDIVVPGGCPGTSAIMRTWIAVDDCMNETSGLQMITVADTAPPIIELAVLQPLDALPPAPPSPACNAPNSRMVEIQCGGFDDCSAATIDAVLRVTQTVVNMPGECTEVVDLVPVSCGDAYELRLTGPACPDVPRSAAHPVVVHPDDPLPIVTGDSIVLEVTAVDECGNVTAVSFDPAVEPSPNCELVTEDGTCCPMIARPPAPPSCPSQPCDGQPPLDLLEAGDAPPADAPDRRRQGIRGRPRLP